VSGSGISWAICKSAPCSRQITISALHHSVFYRLDALPATQPTASKHWRLPLSTCVISLLGEVCVMYGCYWWWWHKFQYQFFSYNFLLIISGIFRRSCTCFGKLLNYFYWKFINASHVHWTHIYEGRLNGRRNGCVSCLKNATDMYELAH